MKIIEGQHVDVLVTADYPPGFEMEFEGYVTHAKREEQIVISADGAITWEIPDPSPQLPRKPMMVYTRSFRDKKTDITYPEDLPNRRYMYRYTEIEVSVEHPNGTYFDLEFRVTFKEGKRNRTKQLERELRKILNYTGPIIHIK